MTDENNIQNEEINLSEILLLRRKKLEDLKSIGKNPYEIVKYDRDTEILAIKSDFETYENKDVSIAGRIMSRRD
ncbi:MAG: lysine--tRNA ligase, partial [Clostridia bacterium]